MRLSCNAVHFVYSSMDWRRRGGVERVKRLDCSSLLMQICALVPWSATRLGPVTCMCLCTSLMLNKYYQNFKGILSPHMHED